LLAENQFDRKYMSNPVPEPLRPTSEAVKPVVGGQCRPLPEWVEHLPYADAVSGMSDPYIDNGVLRILFDSQTNLNHESFSQHFRTVQRIVTRAGAEKAAHFAVEFDPELQRVDVHFIRVWRSEEQIDHAKPDAFQILRREKKLEQLALDGRLTATLLIPDLRVDDVLDVSLTITNSNPIIGRQYAGWFAFNALAPCVESRHRLRRPVHREIAQKAFCGPPDAVVTTTQDAIDTTWSLSNQKRLETEEFTPPWQIQVPAVQLSEYRDWNQVAQLFAGYYVGSELPAELALEVDRIAQKFSDPGDRASEWLRFVQKQLRYFAMSLGEGGFIPRDLDTIWTRRFGDCKDGSRLFVAGAHRLGLDACAALTSTTHGRVLDEFLPSPTVFNHCIVRLLIDGRTYWLDPTMQKQEGRLAAIFQPHSGWALPLTSTTQALERLENDEPITYRETEELFQLGPKPESPATVSMRVSYYSFAADGMRQRIENEGLSKLADQVTNELRATWPDLVETAPLKIDDNPATNCLVASFSYEIRNAWKPVDAKGRWGFKLTVGSIATELNPLKRTQRRTDVHLGRPRRATWKVRMVMPRRWYGKGWNSVMNAAGIRYSNALIIAKREVRLERELLISRWCLPAAEAGAYQELVAKVRDNWVTIFGRVGLGRIGPAAGGLFALMQQPLRAIPLLIWVIWFLWFLFKAATG
jgi:transglutaminase-like putative cysteine protease